MNRFAIHAAAIADATGTISLVKSACVPCRKCEFEKRNSSTTTIHISRCARAAADGVIIERGIDMFETVQAWVAIVGIVGAHLVALYAIKRQSR